MRVWYKYWKKTSRWWVAPLYCSPQQNSHNSQFYISRTHVKINTVHMICYWESVRACVCVCVEEVTNTRTGHRMTCVCVYLLGIMCTKDFVRHTRRTLFCLCNVIRVVSHKHALQSRTKLRVAYFFSVQTYPIVVMGRVHHTPKSVSFIKLNEFLYAYTLCVCALVFGRINL